MKLLILQIQLDLFWKIDMIIIKDNIFEEARRCNLEVLRSDLVDKVKDEDGWTPLHWLAYRRVKEILDHPFVDKVKDIGGNTPLHVLAWNGVKEILSHSSVDKVKNRHGATPLHALAWRDFLTKKNLREKYPWYKKEIKDILKAVNEIINTPKSIQFILED